MSDNGDSIQVEVSESLAEQQAEESAGQAVDKALEATGKPSNPVASKDNGESAGDDANEAGEQQPEAVDTSLPHGIQKKLDKLTARVYARDEKIRERDARIAELESRYKRRDGDPEQEKGSPAAEEEAPTLESCNFDQAEFIRQSIAHGIKAERTREAIEAKQQAIKERQQHRLTTFKERADAFAAETPDFKEVAFSPKVRVTDEMAEAIQELDNGPAVAYYLGKNPDEALRISGLSPVSQAVALSKIEAHVAPVTVDDADGVVAQRKITSAPPPIKTLNPSAPVKKALAELPMDEYVAERTKSLKKTGGWL
jgi:hypothetical protein